MISWAGRVCSEHARDGSAEDVGAVERGDDDSDGCAVDRHQLSSSSQTKIFSVETWRSRARRETLDHGGALGDRVRRHASALLDAARQQGIVRIQASNSLVEAARQPERPEAHGMYLVIRELRERRLEQLTVERLEVVHQQQRVEAQPHWPSVPRQLVSCFESAVE